MNRTLSGVFAAALTPIKPDFSPDLEAIPLFLDFLARRGCHGAFLLGTTGEGPSFSTSERLDILSAGAEIRQVHPEFCLLAGTGTPSWQETITLTKEAFDLGYDGVVVLPPYYYRQVTEEGLFNWFEGILKSAVPREGALFGYHIPQITQIPFSLGLLSRLMDAFPGQFTGIKDSSGDPGYAHQLGERFGNSLVVFTGNDRLFTLALQSKASGCITAMSNLISPQLRMIWDSFCEGIIDVAAQEHLDLNRAVMDKYPPAPPLLKALLGRFFNLPRWSVRPPLMPISLEIETKAAAEFDLA